MKNKSFYLFILTFIICNNNSSGQRFSDTLLIKEVKIIETKIPKSVLESPVTISEIDSKKIEQLSSENFYSGLATFKGIDVSTNSLFYHSINMRGPSNPVSESVLQLIDGMDNTPPGQGFMIGNLAGENDIDIERVWIIPGSSSAIYGANAFSGLIYIHSKSPFKYPGLSFQIKNGVTHIDGKKHSPTVFSDYQVRYAKAWKDRIAIKFDIGYQRGTDWQNLDQTDFNVTTPKEERGLNNPARELLNVYGDETVQTLVLGTDSNEVDVSRTGYNANDVLGTITNDLKLNSSIHYKLNKNTELSYLLSYSIFNTNVSPYTWNFRKFSVTYHKAELKNKNYFIRAYTLNDYDGNSFSALKAATYIIGKWKSDSAWFSDYTNAYNGIIQNVDPNNHTVARNYADVEMPQPGSDLYKKLFSESVDKPLNLENGSRFEDRSNLQHVHAQYDFSSMFNWMKIISGMEFRSRNLWSNGTLFLDYPPAHYINTKNYGAYIQCEKKLFSEKLNILGSLRYDKNDNYKGTITPRFATMYKLNDNNYFRVSFQTGARNPDPFDEFGDSQNGILFRVGGSLLSDEKYHIHDRAFELQSFYDFLTAAGKYVEENGIDSADAAVQLYKGILKPANLDYVHSEYVQTVEIGYQRLLFNKKLHLDIDFFGSIYKDLIAYQKVVIADVGNPYSEDSLNAAATAILYGGGYSNVIGLSVPVNAKETVRSGGVEASFEYNFWKDYTIGGNFIYQKTSERDPKIDSWLYQTSPIKTNVSISNPVFYKNIGFSINWHWTDAMDKYWSFVDPDVSNNNINANNILDAQVTLTLPKMKSSIKFGASNLLNHYYRNIAYGSSIGGVYYISIRYGIEQK